MKNLILVLLVVSLVACHSTTESEVSSDSAVVKAVDSIVIANDSVKVDSVKVIDTLKK
jgi:hypothetical protein